MTKGATAAERFPEQELAIYRLCAHDPRFLGICEDYDEAVAALRRWDAADASRGDRVQEYRQIVADLEGEIETALAAEAARTRRQMER
jgi:hypothetical protein